jgi:putative N6-adenine-specific DNA methylase
VSLTALGSDHRAPVEVRLATYHRLWQSRRVTLQIFAVCAPGLEPVLLAEVQALGCKGNASAGGVEIEGTMRDVQRLNLWLRTASRVLVRLGTVKATAFPELVRKASALPWERYLRPGAAASLRVTCRKSRLYHSGAVAERLHAAMEARLGAKVPAQKGSSEDEEGEAAQLIVARFDHDVCTVSADSSGALLHQRGYRGPQAKAPLRETLAAALLLAAGWKGETPLCDPLCGSGTIAIEAALIALRRAPGIARGFAFQKWPGFDVRPFQDLLAVAKAGFGLQASGSGLPTAGFGLQAPGFRQVEASDQDAGAVAATRENAARADVAIEIVQRQLAALPPAPGAGLIACNPPYGVRVGGDVRQIFRELGEAARRRPGWRVAAVVADEHAAAASGLRWTRLLRTQTGGIPVQFLAT